MISTDMIREVMRKIVSRELLPSIYESSYTALPVPEDTSTTGNWTRSS